MFDICKFLWESITTVFSWTMEKPESPAAAAVDSALTAPAVADSALIAPAVADSALIASAVADPAPAAPAVADSALIAPAVAGPAPAAPASPAAPAAPGTDGTKETETVKAVSRKDTCRNIELMVPGQLFREENRNGVADTVRALDLPGDMYENLVHVFCSDAINDDCCRAGLQNLLTECGYLAYRPGQAGLPADRRQIVPACDHRIQAKEGRRIPGVSKLHQASENVNRSQTVTGLKYGAVGLLPGDSETGFVCAPVAVDIEYGFNGTVGWNCSDVTDESSNTRAVRKACLVSDTVGRDAVCAADSAFLSNGIINLVISHNNDSEHRFHVLTRASRNCSLFYYNK